jgi:hypothetical protein
MSDQVEAHPLQAELEELRATLANVEGLAESVDRVMRELAAALAIYTEHRGPRSFPPSERRTQARRPAGRSPPPCRPRVLLRRHQDRSPA